jgi:signal transduction histidine kinase
MWPVDRAASEHRIALVVAVVFVIAGSAWILFTDLLLYSVIQDRATVARIETAKGWAFVALSALPLYAVTRRSAARLARAHRAISAVLESIGDGVLLLGSDHTIAYANPESIRMLRATNLDDLRGMGAPEFSRRFHLSYPDGHLVPPEQFASQRVFEEPGPIRYKALLYPPSGPEVVISCTAAAVRQKIGTPADLVVSVMHDITATEHLERLRDELFTGTAHALKTPIAVIKGAAQVLARGEPTRVRHATTMIERQLARIERLVENLLALSRIRSGTLQLYPAEVELAPVVEDVAAEVSKVSSGHDIHLRLDARPRSRVDRERIAMALRNVIHGAIRSAGPERPVTVSLERHGADADIGVTYQPPPSKDELGDDCQPSTDFDDIGVGRYVTAVIVEGHGGRLTERAEDGDTTVRITLPAA